MHDRFIKQKNNPDITSLDENHFEQLPLEIVSMVINQLEIRDLALLTQVNKNLHMAVDNDLLWKGRCHEFSPLAIQEIKNYYRIESWKEIYHRLTEATDMANLRLQNYYLELENLARYQTKTDLPGEDNASVKIRFGNILQQHLNDKPEQNKKAQIFLVGSTLHGWGDRFTPLEQALEEERGDLSQWWDEEVAPSIVTALINEYCEYADYLCKFFSAAATGNTALLHHLIQEREPVLEDLFNPDHWHPYFRNDPPPTSKQHPMWGFPIKFALVSRETGEPCLVDFARFYRQQSILNCYYQVALKHAPKEDRLGWAIICHQSPTEIDELLRAGLDVNGSKKADLRTSFPRHYRPLDLAILWGDIETANLLIQQGAKVNNYSHSEIYLLMFPLLVRRQYDMVSKLVDKGASLYGMDKNLMFAVMDGNVHALLAHYGSDLAANDEALGVFGLAWDVALHQDWPSSIQLMIDAYPRAKKQLITRGDFHMAVISGSTGIVDLMISSHVNTSDAKPLLLQLLIEHAIYFDNMDILLRALDFGIDMNKQSKQTILSWIEEADFDRNSANSQKVRDIVLCEKEIQLALSRASTPYLLSSLYSYKTLDAALQSTFRLEPAYFSHRMESLVKNKSDRWDEKIIDQLSFWTMRQEATLSAGEKPQEQKNFSGCRLS